MRIYKFLFDIVVIKELHYTSANVFFVTRFKMVVFKNFWLKEKEPVLLKVIDWAQKHGVKVENISKREIREAVKSKL
jgi:hypothetical protein